MNRIHTIIIMGLNGTYCIYITRENMFTMNVASDVLTSF